MCLSTTFGSISIVASELTLSPLEIKNLAIETSSPEVSDRIPVLEARAQVVLPPNAEVIIAAPVPGLVIRQHVTVGEIVASGQILANLRSSDLVALQREFLDAVTALDLTLSQLKRDRWQPSCS